MINTDELRQQILENLKDIPEVDGEADAEFEAEIDALLKHLGESTKASHKKKE